MRYSTFIHLETMEYPLHEGDIRLRFPDMQEFFIPDGYAGVEPSESPDVGTYVAVYEDPPLFVDGAWKQNIKTRPYTDKEKEDFDRIMGRIEEPKINTSPGSAPDVTG